ncbi:MAG TPA: hypothetical protein VFS43_24565 [Polyangiaceae bacterium]|nr:hypothetical protein [Polyangiaceae bacterium]
MFALQNSRFQRTLVRNLAALASSLLLAATAASAAGCDDEDDNPGASGSGAGAAAGTGGSGTGGSGTGGTGTGGSGTGGSGTGGSGGGASAGAGGGAGGGDVDDGCTRGELEADLAGPPDGAPIAGQTPLAGPGVDPTTGALKPGNYIISTTYLRMPRTEAAQARFGELLGPITESLPSMAGLVASSFSSSNACATARTLTVWESEEAMLEFVTSPAHATAMAGAREVSRGGSAAMSWSGTEADVTWSKAAEKIGADPGLGY